MLINQNTILKTSADCKSFHEFVKDRKTILISDNNIFNYYPELFADYEYILIGQGEEIKNLNTINILIERLISISTDRNSLIIGIGGGIVTDIVGFVAGIFMRGVSFGFIPTTLLAQVDAAIGGKNGINFENLKNYVGSFKNPEFIICDSIFLKTLPEIQYKSGLGEIFKYTLISNSKLFDFVEDNYQKVLEKDKNITDYIVNECIKIKTSIVKQDPFDYGLRNILNLGHSFAHSIEINNKIPHGIAVVEGIKIASRISLKLNLLSNETYSRIINLAHKLGFLEEFVFTNKHIDLLLKDKKKNKDVLKLVVINDIGNVKTQRFNEQQIKSLL